MNSEEYRNKVIVIHNESHKTITITLRYINEELGIDRVFNFQRSTTEKTSRVLCRIGDNITKIVSKKCKKRIPDCQIIARLILINNKTSELDVGNVHCFNTLFKDAEKYYLCIDSINYTFVVNPPILMMLDLPKKCIMAGFPIYPTKLEGINCKLDETRFKWFRSQEKFEDIAKCSKSENLSWEEIGEGFKIFTSNDEVSRLIKVIGTPYKGIQKGIELECISSILVSPGPGHCPFEKRQNLTSEILNGDFLRVMSYNILADMYADSEHSKFVLYPYCPPYALDIEYRKQLFIKEILGFNADLICLQEVDKKVFWGDLLPVLSHHGLDGVFNNKGGSTVSEGEATFYRKEKLTLKENCSFTLCEELDKNPLFKDLLEKVHLNLSLYKSFMRRGTILQVVIFARNSNPSQIIVLGVTHLYYEPYSDHIRLLQAGMCLTILRQIMDLQKAKSSLNDVSLIFCGDFNSVPENAVYRFMTSQLIDEDDPDWSSKPGEEVSNVSFSHDLEISSACGTPAYTNYVSNFNGCLDYIFYQSDKFSVEQFIPFPSHQEVTKYTALPSVTFPSDHISLVADLKWKQ